MRALCRLALAGFALLLLPAIAFAITLAPIPYSGHLLEGGVPVTGTRWFVFQIMGSATGGAPFYTQAESLQVEGGVYHTTLNTASTVWTGEDRWVGVSVNSAPELTPRVQVGWVPYAVRTRFSPILVTRPLTSLTVTEQWTRIDSLTIDAPTDGITILNVTGDGVWNGAITQVSASLSIDEATPGTFGLQTLRAISAADAFSVTRMVVTSAGIHKFYFWGRSLLAGQTYFINSRVFQATFMPN